MSHSVCGGPSEARPGFETLLSLSATAIAERIASLVGRDAAALIGTLVATRTFDLPSFCASDPPADPGVTPLDLLALAQPQFLSTWLPAADKFLQWWSHQYWYIACQCTGGVTPTAPPPSNPGPAGRDTGLPAGPTQLLCWDGTATRSGLTPPDTGTNTNVFTVLNEALPGTVTQHITPGLDTRITSDVALLLPPGPINDVTLTIHASGGTDDVPWLRFMYYNAAGTQVAGHSIFQGQPALPTWSRTLNLGAPPAGATCWYPFLTIGNNPPVDFSFTLEVTYTCGGGPNEPVVPCCPPDPTVEIKLNQILELLINLHLAPPGAPADQWQDGIRHANLSGASHIALARSAVGVRVEVTSLPSSIDVHPGDPAFYFDMGFITPLALDTPLRGQRLVFNPQSFELPSFADSVAWTLPTGVVIDLVELLPLI